MAKEPYNYDYEPEDEYDTYGDEYNDLLEEYGDADEDDLPPEPSKPKASQKPRRRLKRQDFMLFGSMAIAAVLLLSVIVMMFGNIVKPTAKPAGSGSLASGQGSEAPGGASGSTIVAQPNHPTAADPNAWSLRLISPAYPVESSFTPPELAEFPQKGVMYYVDARVMDSLLKMMEACNAVEGHSLRVVSAYRSYSYQQKQYTYYYNNYKALGLSDEEAAAKAREHEMPAGTTEHHTGLAVDFVTGSVQTPSQSFAETGEFAWLTEHAAEYGFILRYPADKVEITGMPYEPYHFRFVGTEEAAAMKQSNLTLEEYVNLAGQQAANPEDTSTPEAVK